LLIVIDNYDSFTYNLVQYLGELGQTPVANSGSTAMTKSHWEQIRHCSQMGSTSRTRSPRRCRNFPDLIQHMGSTLPILVGHQSIGQVFGGEIVSAPELMHGKNSGVSHWVGVFED